MVFGVYSEVVREMVLCGGGRGDLVLGYRVEGYGSFLEIFMVCEFFKILVNRMFFF